MRSTGAEAAGIMTALSLLFEPHAENQKRVTSTTPTDHRHTSAL